MALLFFWFPSKASEITVTTEFLYFIVLFFAGNVSKTACSFYEFLFTWSFFINRILAHFLLITINIEYKQSGFFYQVVSD